MRWFLAPLLLEMMMTAAAAACSRASAPSSPPSSSDAGGGGGGGAATVDANSKGVEDPNVAIESIVRADFQAEIAKAPMPTLPSGVNIDVTCCVWTGVSTHPAGASISLLLPPPPDSPASARPTTALGEAYSIDHTKKPPVMLRRPDFDNVRRKAVTEAYDAIEAFKLAHAKLVMVDAYANWKKDGSTYTTVMQRESANKEVWSIYFRRAESSIQTINVRVDVRAKSAVSVDVK